MVETHAAVEVSDVRQAPAVSLAGNPQSSMGLQASGSGTGQNSELSQLTTIMMSIVSRLDATVSRLDVTQGQVAELRLLVVNGKPDGAPGVSDSQQTNHSIPVSCGVQAAAAASIGSSSVPPSLNQMRSSDALVSQEEKLVNSMDVTQGQSNSKVLKRGWTRHGGDNAPRVPTPWPQDFVLGHGAMRALSYEDLSVYQWVQGYLSIAQMQGIETLRAMVAHMQALFTEASFAGWDPAKFAHGCVLTDLEDGMYGWLDRVSSS
jgi:hypothetical protein